MLQSNFQVKNETGAFNEYLKRQFYLPTTNNGIKINCMEIWNLFFIRTSNNECWEMKQSLFNDD